MASSSSLVKGDDETEEVEFLEAVVASLIRFWMAASSLRYLSKSMMKLVMPSQCMTEISFAWSQVYISQATCLMVGVIEFQVVNREFTIMLSHSTWR